jgi:general secretion pathway protein F
MPIYVYQALTVEGKKTSGDIEASSKRDANDRLRAQGLMLTSLFEQLKSSKKGAIKGEQLVAFTGLLAQLIDAGMPLFESLIALEEQYRDETFHSTIASLCEEIKEGTSLSESMAQHPDSFDRLYCSMVEAGESAGALGDVLKELSQYLDKQSKIKRQIVTAMIYPSVLASFSCLIIILLLTFVVPSMESLFEGREVNGLTSFVLSLSHLIRSYWFLYIPVLALVGSTLYFKLRSKAGKLWIQRIRLKLPLIRTVTVQAALTRFCRTMGTLQDGGVTVIESLRIARQVMRNVTLEEEIEKAEKMVIEGSSLSAELEKSPWIPSMLPRMLAIGEESGSSVAMFQRVAEIYEGDLQKNLDRVMALAQPIILIVMGFIIGIVMMAILLPLSDVTALTG